MNGPEHYREAERLLAKGTTHHIAAAQVHATLALAWATAYTADDMSGEYYRAWGHFDASVYDDARAGVNALAEEQEDANEQTFVGRYLVPATDFTRGDPVSVADPTHRHYGRHGRIIGYVYDPPGYAVEYDNLGSTLILAHDQLRCEVSLEAAAEADAVAPIPAPRDDEQHDGGDKRRFTSAQLDGDACTVCGTWLIDGQATVSSAYVPGAGQLFAHLRCVPDDEPTADPCAICGDCIASGEDFVTRGPDGRPEYAHANCAEAVAADELTNRDVDSECDAAEDAYGDTPMYDGSEATR